MIRKALVQARLLMGLSQEKVAERIGVTRNTISQWERGIQNPYPIYVHALCTLFGKSAQELALDARWRELDQRAITNDMQGPRTLFKCLILDKPRYRKIEILPYQQPASSPL